MFRRKSSGRHFHPAAARHGRRRPLLQAGDDPRDGGRLDMAARRHAAVLLGVLALGGCASGALDREQILYTAIGASDAVGIGAFPLGDGYVYRIEDAVEAEGRDVALFNLGIPAANLPRIGEAVQIYLEVTRREPDLVTIWVGPNDVISGVEPAAFAAALADMLDTLQDKTDAYIVMANIPDLTRLPRFRQDPQATVTPARIAAFNTAIAEQAEDYDVAVLDFFAQPVEDNLVSDIDGFHPNSLGHARIAAEFLSAILPALE